MRYLKILLVVLALISLTVSCKKQMPLTDYSKIEIEIATSDQKPETKGQIAKKYGYTLEQYETMAKKVENDIKLQEKLGELRLKEQKGEKK